MKRSEFIYLLCFSPLLAILLPACDATTTPVMNEEFMGKAEGKSESTATVTYKVIGKDGKVKAVKTETMKMGKK